jgi:hypothetical protein
MSLPPRSLDLVFLRFGKRDAHPAQGPDSGNGIIQGLAELGSGLRELAPEDRGHICRGLDRLGKHVPTYFGEREHDTLGVLY